MNAKSKDCNVAYLKLKKEVATGLKPEINWVGLTELEVSGEIPLCLSLETEESKGTQRKRKPKQ
jgi:hypothetical protein